MLSNLQLFSIGNFEFRLQHLLIIGVLLLAFSISFLVRSQPADYGFQLNEFDPFFNFRATQFIVDNGLFAYFDWQDDKSWHPSGRNVSATSQIMLHITAASLYQIFGGATDLYSFTILFPVVIGSLTTVVMFALVRVIGGTTSGLFASLFFALSIPVIIRGTIGWFKSEPLGLFYGLLGVYLFLSGIRTENRKIAILKLVGGGIFLGFGLASWGGIQFFIIPLGLFFLALPFVRKDHNFLIWAIPVFVSALILLAAAFERPGINFVTGIGGFSLIGPTIFLVACILIQKISKEEHKLRNGIALLAGTIVGGIAIFTANASSKFLPLPSFRYLNAINPFLTTQDPLVDSVAEHATTTIEQSFWFLSVFMIFAGIGVWLIFRYQSQHKTKVGNDMATFALIIGLIGVYISSAFVRLEVYASISVIILASVGLAVITSEIFKTRKPERKKIVSSPGRILKISYVVVIVALLIVPPSLPGAASWISGIKAPPTILNGGSNFNVATDDWLDAMEWLKNNTPEDAVVAAWWDYGYWISTLGERTSLADNATLSTAKIQQIARMFLSSPDEGWEMLQELDADYVLVFATSSRISEQGDDPPLYLLTGGGDESKKQWFMRIGGFPESQYIHQDGLSGTDYFWQNTLLGQMFPFTPVIYVNFANNAQSQTYQPGYTPLYVKDVKYPAGGGGPLKLAYSSPTFDRKGPGPIIGVYIYEVNKEYEPGQAAPTTAPPAEIFETTDSAVITTNFGDITIELNGQAAPNTVENFKTLANSGFYDGTIFHRIIPGFVIQGGDPNTISGSRDTWGQGGPGYSINAEFSDIKHEKYIVSMARGSDINSAGSQFFIVLDNAPWLDGKYTVFGKVTSGQEVVDQIAELETNSQDQPVDPTQATIEQIRITSG